MSRQIHVSHMRKHLEIAVKVLTLFLNTNGDSPTVKNMLSQQLKYHTGVREGNLIFHEARDP